MFKLVQTELCNRPTCPHPSLAYLRYNIVPHGGVLVHGFPDYKSIQHPVYCDKTEEVDVGRMEGNILLMWPLWTPVTIICNSDNVSITFRPQAEAWSLKIIHSEIGTVRVWYMILAYSIIIPSQVPCPSSILTTRDAWISRVIVVNPNGDIRPGSCLVSINSVWIFLQELHSETSHKVCFPPFTTGIKNVVPSRFPNGPRNYVRTTDGICSYSSLILCYICSVPSASVRIFSWQLRNLFQILTWRYMFGSYHRPSKSRRLSSRNASKMKRPERSVLLPPLLLVRWAILPFLYFVTFYSSWCIT